MAVPLADCPPPCWPIFIGLLLVVVGVLVALLMVGLAVFEVAQAPVEHRPVDHKLVAKRIGLALLIFVSLLALEAVDLLDVPGISPLA